MTDHASRIPKSSDAGDVRIRGVTLALRQSQSSVSILDGIDLDVPAGTTLGVVGESGSGKSMLARSIMRLVPPQMELSGSISVGGQSMLELSSKEVRSIWGSTLAIISQDSMRSLNPVVRVGRQIAEAMRVKLHVTKREAYERGTQLLREVGIPSPKERMRSYPHELSGGMRQRVCIAMALACEPQVLIADEPTTALDVTVQHQILDLLEQEQQRRGMSLILISHDLGVVAGRTSRIAVMYAGRLVEVGETRDVFASMKHRYTDALFRAVPRLDAQCHAGLYTIPSVSGTPAELDGCRFAPRCHAALTRCHVEVPTFVSAPGRGHQHACFNPIESGEAHGAGPPDRDARSRGVVLQAGGETDGR